MRFDKIADILATTPTKNPVEDMVTTAAVTEFIMRQGVAPEDKIAAKNHWYERELRRAYAF